MKNDLHSLDIRATLVPPTEYYNDIPLAYALALALAWALAWALNLSLAFALTSAWPP